MYFNPRCQIARCLYVCPIQLAILLPSLLLSQPVPERRSTSYSLQTQRHWTQRHTRQSQYDNKPLQLKTIMTQSQYDTLPEINNLQIITFHQLGSLGLVGLLVAKSVRAEPTLRYPSQGRCCLWCKIEWWSKKNWSDSMI